MTYPIVRFCVRFVLGFFIKSKRIVGLSNIPSDGPVLLAVNHPNSFLDAIILACYLDRRVWSLARGDAFKKPLAKRILSSFYMIPIYRISEGKEYVSENEVTFQKCLSLFRNNQVVLIFSEGICLYQDHLLPLKKGTARLTQMSWQQDIPLQIIPIGLTYNDYSTFGKNVTIKIGESIIQTDELDENETEGVFVKKFNDFLRIRLEPLISKPYKLSGTSFQYIIGLLLNFPLYGLLIPFVRKKTHRTVFYDSVLLALLVVTIVPYWLFLFFILSFLF
ncbi:MAG: 1-acyl-sn-glycerol-3-phosphate acyltransferase [Spirosomataceae bacterium]